MIIDVYPSQDNPTNQTLWIFSGSSTARSINSIRTSISSTPLSNRDSWWFGSPNSGNIFQTNGPANSNISLSPLFSSSSNPIDIESIQKRIPGGARTQVFAASATNAPTITIGSRTISHLFMQDDTTLDEMGIRVSGSALSYSSGNSSAWVGAGIINKPIGDFFTGTYALDSNSRPDFAANNGNSLRVVVNSQIIPEPEEYALVFGLFALAFVFFHRRMQRKRRQQASTL